VSRTVRHREKTTAPAEPARVPVGTTREWGQRRPRSIPTPSLQVGKAGWKRTAAPSRNPYATRLHGHVGQDPSATQIYEGTNQVQRVVISKRLLS